MLTVPETPEIAAAREAMLAAGGNRFKAAKAIEALFGAMLASFVAGGKLEEASGEHPLDVKRAEHAARRERQLIRNRAEHTTMMRARQEEELTALVERRDQLAAGHAELRREASAIPVENTKLTALAAAAIEDADSAMSAIVAQIAAAEGALETARIEETEAVKAEEAVREADAAKIASV